MLFLDNILNCGRTESKASVIKILRRFRFINSGDCNNTAEYTEHNIWYLEQVFLFLQDLEIYKTMLSKICIKTILKLIIVVVFKQILHSDLRPEKDHILACDIEPKNLHEH